MQLYLFVYFLNFITSSLPTKYFDQNQAKKKIGPKIRKVA